MVDSPPQGAPIDRYVVLEYLSEGGMGAIYLGKKLGAGGFEKQVVLKQLLPEFTSQPEFIDLFLREARLSATLDHANIIHTIDLVTAGSEHFIVMEYLDGADLRTLVKKAKRNRVVLSAAAGIYIAREVLSALAYAHSKIGPDDKPLRLIHRDVSPSNILVSHNGEAKLTDFGIAKASTHNSVFYRVKGKIGYMSPEQARNDPLDHRSDLYSLAVCLYEVITGEKLFVHAGLTTSADEIYNQPIPLVSRKIPGLPADLDKVMLKALAMDPAHRYQSAGEFQEALLRCAHRHGLMMSAPVLAAHLREVCGPPEQWRDLEAGGEHGTAAIAGGTEIYSDEDEDDDDDDGYLIEGTAQLDLRSLEASDDLAFNDAGRRRKRAMTSITNLTRLKDIELTSMINLADMEAAGAEPLIELGAFDVGRALSDVDGGMESGIELADSGDDLPRVDSIDEELDDDQEDSLDGILDPVLLNQAVVADSGSRFRLFWMVLAVILLLGIGAAAAIGLSGPTLK